MWKRCSVPATHSLGWPKLPSFLIWQSNEAFEAVDPALCLWSKGCTTRDPTANRSRPHRRTVLAGSLALPGIVLLPLLARFACPLQANFRGRGLVAYPPASDHACAYGGLWETGQNAFWRGAVFAAGGLRHVALAVFFHRDGRKWEQ